jgi:hypothetical protein
MRGLEIWATDVGSREPLLKGPPGENEVMNRSVQVGLERVVTTPSTKITTRPRPVGGSDPTFDVNGDGVVNAADLAAFRTNFGMAI